MTSVPVAIPAWWETDRELLLKIGSHHDSCFVYKKAQVIKAGKAVLDLPVDRVFYAIKANPHADILKTLRMLSSRLGFECVSIGEVKFILNLFGASASYSTPLSILFTPNFAPRKEYVEAFTLGRE